MTNDELKKAIEAKLEAKREPAKKAAEEYERRFLEAYLAALDTRDPAELVIVDVPRVGKTLHGFASRPDHAAFTRAINEKIEVAPCLTFSSRTVIFPPPPEFKALLEEKNPEGFVTCAIEVKNRMKGQAIEEGKE